MNVDFKSIFKSPAFWVGLIAFLGVGSYLGGLAPTLAFQTEELRQEVQLNTDDRLMQRWKFLNMKRENQGLPPHELVEFCQISAKLGLKGEGCA